MANSNTNADPSPWSFRSGSLALDFANTVDWHESDQPVELLNTYSDVLAWSVDFDALSEPERRRLSRWAGAHPDEAEAALQQARSLRDAVYRIFSTIAGEGRPDQRDLDQLADAYVQAVDLGRVAFTASGVSWHWDDSVDSVQGSLRSSNEQPSGVDALKLPMLWPVAVAALELLRSDDLDRVGQCEDDRGCGALFLDTSRNRSRQWCRMETCGNRAKARRHYARSQG
jgi:predicted RNA-binding Zn ribbon-like protein